MALESNSFFEVPASIEAVFQTPPVPAGYTSWTAYYEKNGWNTGIAGGLPNPGPAMDAKLGIPTAAPADTQPPGALSEKQTTNTPAASAQSVQKIPLALLGIIAAALFAALFA